MTRTNDHPHGEQLSAYIDSMLDVPKMRGIAEHLHVCAACRGIESDLRRTKTLVRGLPGPPLPSGDFWISAYRQLRVDDHERAATKRPFWTVLLSPEQLAQRRWAAGLVAAAIAAGFFSAPLTSIPHPVRTPPLRITADSAISSPDVSPDVSSLAELHTDSASSLPLADTDRQKMIAADVRQAGSPPADGPAAAGDADAPF